MSQQVEEKKDNEEQKNQEQIPPETTQDPKPETTEKKEETAQEQLKEEQKVENNANEQNNANEEKNPNEENNANEENNENEDENGEEEAKENKEEPIEEKKENKDEKKFYNKMKQNEDKSIQDQIKYETTAIEQLKIDLRLLKERHVQRENKYNELQGKPVNKTSEEKEKERRDHKKAIKNHKFTDPIQRKKGREKEIADNREKIAKEETRKKAEFQKLTTDTNELIISNKELKDQIEDLRKRKVEALKKKEKIAEENEQKKKNLEDMYHNNEVSKSQIMHKEYKNAVTQGTDQQKEFEAERDDLEVEYQKLIEEYIKRERENKKENAKKRNMAALALSKKGMATSSRDKDIEMELKKLADEEIMDRTPMLDLCIDKWRVINDIKKASIEIFQQNSTKIRDAFNKLTKYIGLDSFNQLPLVYKKTEQQMSNINMYKEKLETQNDKLEYEKELIINQIKLLSGVKKNKNLEKSQFIKQKIKNIEVIENCADNFKKEIDIRMNMIERIQPKTLSFLDKFGSSLLADYIYGKVNVDQTSKFNEKTVDKYLSNVQDYIKLVQEWEKSTKESKSSENEIDKLREDMKQRLETFEQNRLLTTELCESMELDYKKGKKLEEIIKESSLKIALDIHNPNSRSTVITKGRKKNLNTSNATTEPGNIRYGNNSTLTSKQQSSIIRPNNSSSINNKSKSNAEKVAVPA